MAPITLCNSCPRIWEEEGKPPPPPLEVSGPFGSSRRSQSPPRRCLHQEFPHFFPSSHLPQSLRSPWSPCPRSPKTGAPIASAVSNEPRSLSLTPPRGLRSALTPLDTPNPSWVTGIRANPGGERRKSGSCQSAAHPKAWRSPRFPQISKKKNLGISWVLPPPRWC